MRGYTRLVRGSVRHRWITLIVGALIFAASLWSTKLLPSGFMPADDIGRVLLAVELPPGSRLDDTDTVTRAISEKLRAMPEVRSALIFGGQILGGGAEPRKATFVINFVHKSEREATQKDLQTRIGAMLADQPDIRFWFLKDNGQRDLSLIIAGPDIDVINDTANQIASEMRGDPDHRESDLDRGARSAGTAHRAEAAGRGRPRRLDGGAVGDDPRRDAGRHRRQPRQVQRRRSAGPDPRRARRGGALPGRPAAGPARSDRERRLDAALGRRRFLDEPRTDRDQPLRPHAAGDDRGGSARRRRARRRRRGDPRPADRQGACRPASRSARPATSR